MKKVVTITENDIINIASVAYNRILESMNRMNEDLTRGQVRDEMEDFLKSKEFEKKVNNIVVDTLGEFIESMWAKKSFWKNMVKRK